MPPKAERQQMIKKYIEKINNSKSLKEAKTMLSHAQYAICLTNEDISFLKNIAIDKFKN